MKVSITIKNNTAIQSNNLNEKVQTNFKLFSNTENVGV